MNVFYLNKSPEITAQEHCDKHAVKMCVEYAQLLSTAHRVLDGTEYIGKTKTGRKAKRWKLLVLLGLSRMSFLFDEIFSSNNFGFESTRI